MKSSLKHCIYFCSYTNTIFGFSTLTLCGISIKLVSYGLLPKTIRNMLFRMSDGEIAEVCRKDYVTEQEYLAAIQDVYNIRQQPIKPCMDDKNQTDFIYKLIMGFAPSRL